MKEIVHFLEEYSLKYNLELDEIKIGLLEKYASFLVEWNEKINLTAITEPKQIAIKHFLDSLVVEKYVDIKPNANLIDVGTGAGFPGIPLKILRPDINLTLVDSLGKRVKFLDFLLTELNVKAETKHARAEDIANLQQYRESFDMVTSRAVAQMNVLAEYCLPFAKLGGTFVALKSGFVQEELDNAKNAIQSLGGKIQKIERFTLPEDNSRTIVVIKKLSHTEKKYPRVSAKISKSPL